MPQALKPLDPSLSPRHRFGAELRATRLAKGLSQAGLARLVHVHPDLIAKVEKAVRRPTEALADACDGALNTDGTLAALWLDVALERRAGRPTGLETAAAEAGIQQALEPLGDVAHRLWKLEGSAVGSAMAIFDAAVADLVDRYETEDPAQLAPHAVKLRRNLEQLVDAHTSGIQRRRVLGLAGRASALLAYMAVNLGWFTHADAYSAEAFALGKEAGDSGIMAWVRGTQSFASYYQRDYRQAVEYARDGLTLAPTGPQALRLKVNCEARALAFLPGHRREAERAVGEAYELADRLDVPDGISPCISLGPYSRGRVIANAITVYQTLHQTSRAVDLIEQIDASVRHSDSAWSQSLIRLDHATALLNAQHPDVEQAMHLASGAIAASADRPITSVVQRGQALAHAATRFSHLPCVREFHERVRALHQASDRRRAFTYIRPLRSQP